MSDLRFNITPFNEEQLQEVVNKLAHIFANEMGLIPKELNKKLDYLNKGEK